MKPLTKFALGMMIYLMSIPILDGWDAPNIVKGLTIFAMPLLLYAFIVTGNGTE